MARYCWTFALCLLASSAWAQAPDNDEPREPRGRRGAESQAGDEDRPRERGGRAERGEGGPGEGERGGRFGGGYFRRPNPIFQALDADGDEVISTAELRKAVANLKKLDADGDGQITMAEASPQGGPGGGGPDPNEFADRLMQQDRNGNGKLELNEVDERTAMMFQRGDQDGDGAISRQEILIAFEQMRQRFGGGPGGGGPGFGRGGMNPRDMLGRWDANGDGKLSADEVPEEAKRMLQGRDMNEDGFVDAAELEQMGRGRGGPPGGEGRVGRGRGGEDEAGEDDGPRRPRRPRAEGEENEQ